MPAGDLGEPVADYHRRIDAEHAAGLLDQEDRLALHRLTDSLGPLRWFAHGDPLPTNLLLTEQRVAVLDWEDAGWYLPAWDHALLYTIGASASPTLANAIIARVDQDGVAGAFTVNLGLVLCREIRIHRSQPFDQVVRQRLAALTVLWEVWRQRLHDTA